MKPKAIPEPPDDCTDVWTWFLKHVSVVEQIADATTAAAVNLYQAWVAPGDVS